MWRLHETVTFAKESQKGPENKRFLGPSTRFLGIVQAFPGRGAESQPAGSPCGGTRCESLPPLNDVHDSGGVCGARPARGCGTGAARKVRGGA
jgi:hypothetical protein